jgi:hypothetical protein
VPHSVTPVISHKLCAVAVRMLLLWVVSQLDWPPTVYRPCSNGRVAWLGRVKFYTGS